MEDKMNISDELRTWAKSIHDHEDLHMLLNEAADRIERLTRQIEVAIRWDGDDRAAVLAQEAEDLQQLSKDAFDSAHGQEFTQWEPQAQSALRLRVAADVLKERIERLKK